MYKRKGSRWTVWVALQTCYLLMFCKKLIIRLCSPARTITWLHTASVNLYFLHLTDEGHTIFLYLSCILHKLLKTSKHFLSVYDAGDTDEARFVQHSCFRFDQYLVEYRKIWRRWRPKSQSGVVVTFQPDVFVSPVFCETFEPLWRPCAPLPVSWGQVN